MAGEVLVVGEALVDVVVAPDGSTLDTRPGGAPLNIAVGLARLDVPALLLTTYGDDEYGALVTRHAKGSGVQLLHDAPTAAPTSVARALLDETQQATYEFALHWDPPAVDLPESLAALHVGSLGTVVAPGDASVLRLAEAARDAGVPVTYDPNVRPAISTDPVAAQAGVRRWLELADVVKLSDDDAAYLWPGATADTVLDELLASRRTVLAVVTRGSAGTVLANREHRVEVAAPAVEVVDTVGAGDSFMAALIARMLERDVLRSGRPAALGVDDLRDVGAWAARVAAITCTRRGADPPRRSQLD